MGKPEKAVDRVAWLTRPCPRCDGSGVLGPDAGGDVHDCPGCKGTGQLHDAQRTQQGPESTSTSS